MFSFKRLVNKYSKHPVYELKEGEGFNDPMQGGIWVPGKIEEIEIDNAAIVPLRNEELMYGDGGTYSREDRKLYCYTRLDKGSVVRHKDKAYTVSERLDYEDFDEGLNIYSLIRGDGND